VGDGGVVAAQADEHLLPKAADPVELEELFAAALSFGREHNLHITLDAPLGRGVVELGEHVDLAFEQKDEPVRDRLPRGAGGARSQGVRDPTSRQRV
jgi:hypothetical protein